MSSLHVRRDGMLVLDGAPMPNVMVVATAGSGGKATFDSQQHEGGTGADHVFDGWEDWTLKLRLEITEERAGGAGRYADLAALRRAQRALDGELPVAYLLTGGLPQALGVSRVLITAIDDLDDSSEEDSLWLTLTLLETGPLDHTVQQQAAAAADPEAAGAGPAGAPAAAAPATDFSAEDAALLNDALAAGDGPVWGGE